MQSVQSLKGLPMTTEATKAMEAVRARWPDAYDARGYVWVSKEAREAWWLLRPNTAMTNVPRRGLDRRRTQRTINPGGGMSTREQMAAMAMAAIMTTLRERSPDTPPDIQGRIVRSAVSYADALIAELAKQPREGA